MKIQWQVNSPWGRTGGAHHRARWGPSVVVAAICFVFCGVRQVVFRAGGVIDAVSVPARYAPLRPSNWVARRRLSRRSSRFRPRPSQAVHFRPVHGPLALAMQESRRLSWYKLLKTGRSCHDCTISGRASRRPSVTAEPRFDLRLLVGDVAIRDDSDIKPLSNLSIDLF